MKRLIWLIVASLVCFSFQACSDEVALNTNECPKDSLCLYKQVAFTQSIMPNAYKATIRITESDMLRKGGEIESSVKKDIANTLNEILALSKKDKFCEGGNYDLRPNIQYKDGAARDTVGYTLSFSLQCDVPREQKKDYDSLVANIDKKINKNKFLSFLAPNVSIIASPQSWQEAQDKAFSGALELAKSSAKIYSKSVDKKCHLASAESQGSGYGSAPELKAMSASSDVNWELPIPKEQEITARLYIKYICE